jgi:hypothetical protein
LLAILRRVSLLGWGGGFYNFFDPYLFSPPLRFAEGKQGGIEDDIPPMLAAQSDFPSEPLPGFYRIFNQRIGR